MTRTDRPEAVPAEQAGPRAVPANPARPRAVPENADVRDGYLVTLDCIDCDSCRCIAPDLFDRSEMDEHSYVARQPRGPAEVQDADDAADCCPAGAILRVGADLPSGALSAAPSGTHSGTASSPSSGESALHGRA